MVSKQWLINTYKNLGEEVEIVIASTVSEALKHTHDAFLISLDANFPNDIEWSQKKPWQEVIDSVKEWSGVLIYPASMELENNKVIEAYSKEIKWLTVISPNWKNCEPLCNYLKSWV